MVVTSVDSSVMIIPAPLLLFIYFLFFFYFYSLQAGACVRVLDDNQVLVGRDKLFAFDHVFGPDATQQDVYDTCIAEMVAGCFEGT